MLTKIFFSLSLSFALLQSRAEKKARKTVQKLGLKPVPGIVRVTIKKPKNTLFVIARPDVYKNPTSDTYIVFGQANIENTAEQAAAQAASAFEGSGMTAAELQAAAQAAQASGGSMADLQRAAEQAKAGAAGTEAAAPAADGAAAGGDEDGVSATDIDLVMSQTSVTRAQAVAALKRNKGDIVNSIMELS